MITLLMSCSKDEGTEINFEGSMSARVNGALITFNNASGNGHFDLDRGCYTPFGGIMASNEPGDGSGYDIISLGISDAQGVGTHNANARYIRVYSENNQEGYSQFHFCVATQTQVEEEGVVVITSKTQFRVKGTFSFRAFRYTDVSNSCDGEYMNVTEGSFDISRVNPRSCSLQ